jgi:hypothetical protein
VFRKGLKKSVRFGSTSLLKGCRLRHKPAFYEVIKIDGIKGLQSVPLICVPMDGLLTVTSTLEEGG